MSSTRRDFLKTASIGAFGLAGLGCAEKAPVQKERLPNIVYILADDMGYGDPQCLNPDSKIPTPTINRIAADGMSFTDAHSPSAVCTPTRYGILTGRYSWRTRLKSGVLWGYSPPLIDSGRMTVASLLGKHGYHTACVGKWHLGLGWQTTDGKTPSDSTNEAGDNIDYSKPITDGPLDHGFDYFFGIPASLDMAPYVYVENDKVVEPPTSTVEFSDHPHFYRGGPCAPGFRHGDVLPTITKKAANYINRRASATDDKPFFLYFPLSAPHTPWLPDTPWQGRSNAGVFGDFVTQVDDMIAMIQEVLRQNRLEQNTLLILTSDNGSDERLIPQKYNHSTNYHFRGQKADIWDGGHRIPFFATWPGIVEPGSTCGETISLADLFATCADITGEPLPGNAGEDSFSLLPLLKGTVPTGETRTATVCHSVAGMFSIYQKPWKLILGQDSGGFGWNAKDYPKPDMPAGQLYNLDDDIAEEHNLYDERQDVVERLSAMLEKIKAEGRSRG